MKRVVIEGKDCTETIAQLYDHVVSSMDWGSGFLDLEEMDRVVDFAMFMGYEPPSLGSDQIGLTIAGRHPDAYEIEELESDPPYRMLGRNYPPRARYRVNIRRKS